MTKDEILKKYEDDNEYHLHQVDRKWIMEAMQEYTEQQLRLYGVVKSLKDKEVISFEEFVDKYYERKDFKYFNKRGKAFTATQILTIYDEYINNL